MQSSAWMNDMCPPVGPYSLAIQTAAQITHYTIQQAATANASRQSIMTNTGVQPTQIAINHYAAYSNRQSSNWQNSAAPQQAVTFQQTAGGNNYHLQHSPINMQSGNPSTQVTCGFQQNFHQNHARKSPTQRPPMAMPSNAAYPQQDASAHWNQSVSVRGHVNHGDTSDQHQSRDQSGLYHNVNGESTKLVPLYTTTATSPPVGQMAYTAAPAPAATEHNMQTSHDHHQRGHPPAYPTIMSLQNNSVTTNSSSSGQYPLHYATHYNGGEAAPSTTVNRLSYSKINAKRHNLHVKTQQEIFKQGKIARLVEYLHDPLDALPYEQRKLVRKTNKKAGRVKATQQSSPPDVPHVAAPGDERGGQLLEKRCMNWPSVKNTCETLPPANNAAVHLSPGRTRAIAVVQPLAQESNQVAGMQTGSYTASQADGALSYLKELLDSPVNDKQVGCLRVGLYQNQMAGEPGCVPAVDMQADQRVATTAQQSSSSKTDEDKREMPTAPKGVLELSSVPTIQWTPITLNRLIQDSEKAQTELKVAPICKTAREFLSMLWKGESKNCVFQMSMYKNLMMMVKQFCIEHVTQQAVILSQVADGFEKQLDSYRVLEHNEVYSQPPYESCWLNVNKQLDDIDKEFGFPQCLTQHHRPRLDQTDQVETGDGILAQTVNEASSKMSSSTQREQVDSLQEKLNSPANAIPTSPTSPTSPKKTDCGDSRDPYAFEIKMSSSSTQREQVDSLQEKLDSPANAIPTSPKKTDCGDSGNPYAFEIDVLSPEEAKVIFEQAQNCLAESMDTDDRAESDRTSSVEEAELPEVTDATLCDSNPESKLFCPVEEVCCLARWKEMIWGSKAGSLSECKCKTGEIVIDQPAAHCWPELWGELGEPIEISDDDDDGPQPYSDQDPKNLSHISLDDSMSSIILISDDEDQENDTSSQMPEKEFSDEKETEDISSSDAEINPDPEVESNTQSCSPSVSQISDLDENSEVQLTLSLETEEQTEEQTEVAVERVERTKKRRRSHDRFYPLFKKSKKCKSLADPQPELGGASKSENVLAHATDAEVSASSVRTVKLVLFGSRAQDEEGLLRAGGKSHLTSVSGCTRRVPKILTVQLGPLKRESSKTVLTWECSVQRLYKKWKINFPPTKMQHSLRSVPSLSEEGLEKEEKVSSANAKDWSVSLQNQNVLKFSVLPKSFDFNDGTSEGEKTSDPVPDKPKSDHFPRKNKSSKRAAGTWYPPSEKKRRLLTPPTTKPGSLFHEFQKKYIDKMQSVVNA